jgi:hypothetical protein
MMAPIRPTELHQRRVPADQGTSCGGRSPQPGHLRLAGLRTAKTKGHGSRSPATSVGDAEPTGSGHDRTAMRRSSVLAASLAAWPLPSHIPLRKNNVMRITRTSTLALLIAVITITASLAFAGTSQASVRSSAQVTAASPALGCTSENIWGLGTVSTVCLEVWPSWLRQYPNQFVAAASWCNGSFRGVEWFTCSDETWNGPYDSTWWQYGAWHYWAHWAVHKWRLNTGVSAVTCYSVDIFMRPDGSWWGSTNSWWAPPWGRC